MDGSAGARGPAVVRAQEVRAESGPDGCVSRAVCDPGPDGDSLGRRLVDLPAGAGFAGQPGRVGELMYVISGAGRLSFQITAGEGGSQCGDRPSGAVSVPVGPDNGIWLPAGWEYRIIADSDVLLDVVSLPPVPDRTAAEVATDSDRPLIRNLYDCLVETTGDRQFRVLFGPGMGCHIATQFVGHIPPGRAPDHKHPYDEVVLVLDGHGVVHLDGAEHEVGPGTCTHLRPGQSHCLENTGAATLRVLGVFHPADSPAAKS
jgi:mannose-6-phosphate isomerase-like protein (cupin superfamily)